MSQLEEDRRQSAIEQDPQGHGIAYMRKEEATYAEQVRERLERQLQRRARELGYELKPIHQEVVMPDGEVPTVKPDGEIVTA